VQNSFPPVLDLTRGGRSGQNGRMKIVVTTPTGHVGSRLVPLLLKAGETPTLFCRSAARLPADWRTSCAVVEGDQGVADDVIRAIDDADAVYWVSPPTDDPDPIAGHRRMAESLVAALRTTGTSRVVFQSSVGAEARHGFGDIDGLGATEEALDALGISVTHLRCGYLFTNLLMDLPSIQDGVLSTTVPVDLPVPWVAAEDVAVVAALRLLGTTWQGRHTLAVHGPADLSFENVAAVLGAALDRTVTAQSVSDEALSEELTAFGLTPEQVAAVVGMGRGVRNPGFTPENPRTELTTTTTALAGWAATVLAPLARTA
jgi:uncharacterized protein YbjT (DUF2867 family)